MGKSPLIEFKKVDKKYNSLQVLEDINLTLNSGEFISVIGPSGCGKTTFLKICGGLREVSKGEVLINNLSPKLALQKREIGFVFQNPVLLPWRNSEENVKLPLEILGNINSKRLPETMLNLVGLKNFKNSYPEELSGGMQQRVSIARALTFEPSILLMDEPFGALDEITRDKLNLELLKLWENKKTSLSGIVFVTHSIPEAVFLSDKIIVLSKLPAKIEKIVEVDLPRPRDIKLKNTKKYLEKIECIRKILKED